MKIGLYYLDSQNSNYIEINEESKKLINDLEIKSNCEIDFISLDEIDNYNLVLVFVAGGGTEARFIEIIDKLKKPIFLLTSGINNSLAASIEILSYLNQNSINGEIIHGSNEYMAKRIYTLSKVFETKHKLNGLRLARIGKPSDWLIASDVDNQISIDMNNIEIIDIKMDEFFAEIDKCEYPNNTLVKQFKLLQFDEIEKEKSLYIYGALRRLVEKYKLNGLSVRCFDLIKPYACTSCIGLSLLNAEGIYSSCEGDIPSLVSMCILGVLTNEPCFQANPSRILTDTNEVIFAHCTLPFSMFDECKLMSHYESNLGIGIRGKIAEGPATIFKCDAYAQKYFVSSGVLEKNLTEKNLCRTQILIKLDENVNYFLNNPIGNHHIIIKNDYVDLINDFFRWY